MSVCVEREPPLLTGNPGYCNLPRLDSTCLSAVWYRVGHCCNWSRNAIALLIIEIINGPRYRVGSYSKYLDKSRYLGAKEDVSRCSSSFECTHIYTHTRAFLRDYRFEAVYIIFSYSSFYSLIALCKGSNIIFFSSTYAFLWLQEYQILILRLFKFFSFLPDLIILNHEYRLINRLADNLGHKTTDICDVRALSVQLISRFVIIVLARRGYFKF